MVQVGILGVTKSLCCKFGSNTLVVENLVSLLGNMKLMLSKSTQVAVVYVRNYDRCELEGWVGYIELTKSQKLIGEYLEIFLLKVLSIFRSIYTMFVKLICKI